jgi:adenylate kinase
MIKKIDHENPARSTMLAQSKRPLILGKRKVVVITGTPGTGKTTISRMIARTLKASFIDLEHLTREERMHCRYDDERKTRIVPVSRLRVAIRKQAARADRGLVIDSHISLSIGPPLTLVNAIVLRCDPLILAQRLERRRWSKSKIKENLQAEILDICLWDAVKEYEWGKIREIDTSGKTPNHVMRQVMKSLSERRSRQKPEVDWMSALKRRRILDRYLA